VVKLMASSAQRLKIGRVVIRPVLISVVNQQALRITAPTACTQQIAAIVVRATAILPTRVLCPNPKYTLTFLRLKLSEAGATACSSGGKAAGWNRKLGSAVLAYLREVLAVMSTLRFTGTGVGTVLLLTAREGVAANQTVHANSITYVLT
jgi:hypothetical protein